MIAAFHGASSADLCPRVLPLNGKEVSKTRLREKEASQQGRKEGRKDEESLEEGGTTGSCCLQWSEEVIFAVADVRRCDAAVRSCLALPDMLKD